MALEGCPKKIQEKFQGGVGTGGGSLQDKDCLRVSLKNLFSAQSCAQSQIWFVLTFILDNLE